MNKRSCIYTREVAQITGKTERSAQRLLKKIRNHTGKTAHQFITVSDFSDFTGIPEEDVRRLIK